VELLKLNFKYCNLYTTFSLEHKRSQSEKRKSKKSAKRQSRANKV